MECNTIREYLNLFHEKPAAGAPVSSPFGFVSHIGAAVTTGVKALATPLSVSWQVTRACNLRCVYCSASADRSVDPEALNTEEALALIEQLSRLRTLKVVLLGGEPFVRDDMLAILERLMQHNILVEVGTNGTLITEQVAQALGRILKPGHYYIQVSLDGPDSATNDITRGKHTFRRVVEACGNLRAAGVKFSIMSVVTSHNYDQVPQLYQLAADIGAAGFSFQRVLQVGRGIGVDAPSEMEMLDLAIRLKEQESATPHCRVAFNRPGYLQNIPAYPALVREHFAGRPVATTDGFPLHCTAGRTTLDIDADGSVHPCVFMRFPEFVLGDVRTVPLMEMWESPLIQRLRNITRQDKEGCKSCDLTWCNTGCMGIAYEHTGELLRKDPHCEYVQGGSQPCGT